MGGESARKRRCIAVPAAPAAPAALAATRAYRSAKGMSRGGRFPINLDNELDQVQDSLKEDARECCQANAADGPVQNLPSAWPQRPGAKSSLASAPGDTLAVMAVD